MDSSRHRPGPTIAEPYRRTQHGPLWVILLAAGAALAAGASAPGIDRVAAVALGAGVAFMVLLALCFATLTIEDTGDAIAARFGPLPVFSASIPFASITGVRTARSTLLDGWGIHWTPGKGWIYNLWGFDCVEIHHRGTTTRFGTDDPEGLAAAVASRAGLPIDTAP
ncbi:MAG: hypothetical protein HRU70_05430 [Phycisphaeraceae bacterium]|nr:MAG: hypothetical protein HRU70_05430 [Phycisphaeraceae bacterium]